MSLHQQKKFNSQQEGQKKQQQLISFPLLIRILIFAIKARFVYGNNFLIIIETYTQAHNNISTTCFIYAIAYVVIGVLFVYSLALSLVCSNRAINEIWNSIPFQPFLIWRKCRILFMHTYTHNYFCSPSFAVPLFLSRLRSVVICRHIHNPHTLESREAREEKSES